MNSVSAERFTSSTLQPPAQSLVDEKKDNSSQYTPEKVQTNTQKVLSHYSVEKNTGEINKNIFQESDAHLKNSMKLYDYSRDMDFLGRMKLMSMEEAEIIKYLIGKFPDEFAMPGMLRTAGVILSDIKKIKKQTDFLEGEEECLLKLERDLENLSPEYPYCPSLILTYKYLLFISVLAFREQSKAIDAKLPDSITNRSDRLDWYDLFNDSGINKLAIHRKDCKLTDIENLPWQLFPKGDKYFFRELEKCYFSTILNGIIFPIMFHPDQYDPNVFKSGVPLIPFTGVLSIEDLNTIWPLPLWLLAVSPSEINNADGFDMGPACFFDHDLFHLNAKLKFCIDDTSKYEILLKWIRQLYSNKDSIKCVNFLAVELVIFYIFHEGVKFKKNYMPYDEANFFHNAFEYISDMNLTDLPEKYKNVSTAEVKNAAIWLTSFQLKNYSDAEFKEEIENNELSFEAYDYTGPKQYYNTVKPKPAYMEDVIEQIKVHKRILAECGFNYRRIVSALLIYRKKASTEDLESGFPNKKVWAEEAPEFQREGDWIINYLKRSDLQGAWRCRSACHTVGS